MCHRFAAYHPRQTFPFEITWCAALQRLEMGKLNQILLFPQPRPHAAYLSTFRDKMLPYVCDVTETVAGIYISYGNQGSIS